MKSGANDSNYSSKKSRLDNKGLRVIHICNGFCGDALYTDFFKELSLIGAKQTIIAPVRYTNNFQTKTVEIDSCSILYPKAITSIFDRLIFYRKKRKLLKFCEKRLKLFDFDIMHAHTLFSDGVIAYELHRKFGIPYIVTIRNTDINLFLRYAFFLRKMGLDILENASRVIFISPSYIEQLKSYYPEWCCKKEFKTQVIYNGINEFWLKNLKFRKPCKKKEFRLIFVGDFSKNKNIHSIIKAVELLTSKGYQLSLEAIGYGGKKDQESCLKTVRALAGRKDNITLTPRLTKEKLLEKFDQSDIFVMPSFHETFGLVYAESLTQALPIIYTKEQGFDGVFPEGQVGYSVKPHSIESIASAIEKTIKNYSQLCFNIEQIDFNDYFSWEKIAKKYCDIYNQSIKEKFENKFE